MQIAREHLSEAQKEASSGDLRDALQWSFACLEAAIDALAEVQGIEIEKKHWKRVDAAAALHASGVLLKDLAGLHRLLNEARKAAFYDGEDPDLDELDIEDVVSDLEADRTSTATPTSASSRPESAWSRTSRTSRS